MPTIVELINDDVNADIEEEAKVDATKSPDVEYCAINDKVKGKVGEPILKTIPRPPPFPQRLKKKHEEGKYQKFLSFCK